MGEIRFVIADETEEAIDKIAKPIGVTRNDFVRNLLITELKNMERQ